MAKPVVSIHIEGMEKANRYLKNKRNKIDINAGIGIKKAAFFMQGEVKESIAGRRNEPTSVDTGRFLNSVDISVGKNDALIFSNVPYSKYLEYGTSRISPRRHFNNSKDRSKQKVGEIIANEVKK